jgi:hypothetical protein
MIIGANCRQYGRSIGSCRDSKPLTANQRTNLFCSIPLPCESKSLGVVSGAGDELIKPISLPGGNVRASMALGSPDEEYWIDFIPAYGGEPVFIFRNMGTPSHQSTLDTVPETGCHFVDASVWNGATWSITLEDPFLT